MFISTLTKKIDFVVTNYAHICTSDQPAVNLISVKFVAP